METMRNDILTALNEIGPRWSEQFENKPQLHLFFGCTEDDVLTVNDYEVCPMSAVDKDSIFIDVSSFGFCTEDGDEYRINVEWRFADAPYASTLKHIRTWDISPEYQAS